MPMQDTTSLTIAELREFASFEPCEQRYIKRSLDVGLGRHDAFTLWARDADESASIRSQYAAYRDLKMLRGSCPDCCRGRLPKASLAAMLSNQAEQARQWG